MDPLLQTVVLASNTCDSLELTLTEARRALAYAIQTAIAGGITLDQIEHATGIDTLRDTPTE